MDAATRYVLVDGESGDCAGSQIHRTAQPQTNSPAGFVQDGILPALPLRNGLAFEQSAVQNSILPVLVGGCW